jgi:N-acylglucosamine-6-phosphate 2-epimerase
MSMSLLKNLRGGLIVSCQAKPEEPFYGPKFMSAFARCAELAGAVGIRANGPRDIRAIKKAVKLPVIGINKIDLAPHNIYITPTYKYAKQVIDAGADIVALDGTPRERPNNETFKGIVAKIHKNHKALVMADIAILEEGIRAEADGADIVSTTLSGYTEYSPQGKEPDFKLIKDLVKKVKIPVIAEGKIWTLKEAKQAMDCGAYAVVIGSAITRPIMITKRFVRAIQRG